VALAVAREGGRVELVGSLGDDPEGDVLVVALGRAGVGHSALLRDPAARTPMLDAAGWPTAFDGVLPRLDAGDIELALRYLPEIRVLVVAAEVDEIAWRAAGDAAAYHGAAVVLVVPDGAAVPADLDAAVTVLAGPTGPSADESDPGDSSEEAPATSESLLLFARLVAVYALRLAAGDPPATAFRAAVGAAGWESAGG
jgi:ribokinase